MERGKGPPRTCGQVLGGTSEGGMNLPFFAPFLTPSILSATIWGGTGLSEVPTTDCLRGGSVRASFSEIGKLGVKTLSLDVGFSSDFELGAARWRFDDGRKGVVVNFKLRLLREREGTPALAIGAKDTGSNVLSEPERFLILGKRVGKRTSAYLGMVDGPKGVEAMGGLYLRLSLSTALMLEFKGREANLGAEFEVPILGLFSKWAALDIGKRRDLVVSVGWRL